MQTLIHRNLIFRFHPHSPLVDFYLRKNNDFVRIYPQISISHRNCKTLTLCSIASSQPLNYGGWDNVQRIDEDIHSGESNLFQNFMNSLGIGDKKFAFVYLFGFVCALAVSRVRVSSIVVFPACAVLFALGFSVGLGRGQQFKELRLNGNGNRKRCTDDHWRGSIEKLRNLGDNFGEYNAKVFDLKNSITRNIESHQVTVSDLEGYLDIIESADMSFQNSIDVVESCIQSILAGNQGPEGSINKESGRRRKKLGENGFKFSQYLEGLFGGKLDNSYRNKMELMDAEANDKNLDNILMPSDRGRNWSYAEGGNLRKKNTVRARHRAENFVDGTGMEPLSVENKKNNVVEMNYSADAIFDQTIFNYQSKTKTSRTVSDQHVQLKDDLDETEAVASQSDSYDSVDFTISRNHVKAEASFQHKAAQQTQNSKYSYLENIEEDQWDSQDFSYRRDPKRRPSFVAQNSAQENTFASSSSSILDNDLEFSRYLAEAKNLFTGAKGCLTRQVDNDSAEHALHKSAVLLTKAIDMRPMSLLAVGQLGNTYLLHGELKLRKSRKLRSRLVRMESMAFEEMEVPHNGFDDPLVNKDRIISTLMKVCEECEGLLIKAGRTYKTALSIDANDVRALYNWGLALSFRAQLIADIGPSAARDADQIFMAAIDKFNAMMSRSNDYAPDGRILLLQPSFRCVPMNAFGKN